MKKHEFFSNVKDGKLQSNVSALIGETLKGYEGKRITITIEKLTAKRSLQQNKYLHVLFTVFTDALNELGNEFTMEEVKELCKYKFASYDIADVNSGEIIGKGIKPTSKMNKVELNEFIENIIRWGADNFNVLLPYPNESILINFDN